MKRHDLSSTGEIVFVFVVSAVLFALALGFTTGATSLFIFWKVLMLVVSVILTLFACLFVWSGFSMIEDNIKFRQGNEILERSSPGRKSKFFVPGEKIKIIPKTSFIKISGKNGQVGIHQGQEEDIFFSMDHGSDDDEKETIIPVRRNVMVTVYRCYYKRGFVSLTY
jgi:hypothetical protein